MCMVVLSATSKFAMKNLIYRVGQMVSGMITAVAAVFAPALAFADITYQTQLATTTALFGAIAGDLLQTAVVIIGLVMGIAVFIFLVFWGWRKLKSKGMKG